MVRDELVKEGNFDMISHLTKEAVNMMLGLSFAI